MTPGRSHALHFFDELFRLRVQLFVPPSFLVLPIQIVHESQARSVGPSVQPRAAAGPNRIHRLVFFDLSWLSFQFSATGKRNPGPLRDRFQSRFRGPLVRTCFLGALHSYWIGPYHHHDFTNPARGDASLRTSSRPHLYRGTSRGGSCRGRGSGRRPECPQPEPSGFSGTLPRAMTMSRE